MKNIRYSDLITTLRVFLVGLFASTLCFYPEVFKLIPGLIIIIFIFFTDSLDGYIARKYSEESKFGAFYDIVGDRITETVLLVPFIYLNIASPLILIYFIIKDFLIDYLRLKKFVVNSEVPFKQLNTKWSKFLVSSRFMRAIYGVFKMLMILLFYVLIFKSNSNLKTISLIVSIVSVLVSLMRSLPAFIEDFINPQNN